MDQEQYMALALAACTEEERQQAMARFAVLRPHINEGVLLSEAARDAGVPLRSVQRWLAPLPCRRVGGSGKSQTIRYGQSQAPCGTRGVDRGHGSAQTASVHCRHASANDSARHAAQLDATFI